jgi:hypothetical protein
VGIKTEIVGVNPSFFLVLVSMCIYLQLLLVLREWNCELSRAPFHLAIYEKNMKLQ